MIPDQDQRHHIDSITVQITKTLSSTSIRHQSDAEVLDRCLVNVDARVFAIWVGHSEIKLTKYPKKGEISERLIYNPNQIPLYYNFISMFQGNILWTFKVLWTEYRVIISLTFWTAPSFSFYWWITKYNLLVVNTLCMNAILKSWKFEVGYYLTIENSFSIQNEIDQSINSLRPSDAYMHL